MEEEAQATIDFHIFDLSDDCLINVVNFLDQQSIYALQEAHPRFYYAIGASVAQQKYELDFTDRHLNLEETEKFLKLFGDRVKKLRFGNWFPFKENSKNLMENYCTGGNIEYCAFDGDFKITNEFLEKNEHFFRSLKHLRLGQAVRDETLFFDLLSITNRLEFLDYRPREYFLWYNVPQFLSSISSYPLLNELKIIVSYFESHTIEMCHKITSLKKLTIELYYDEVLMLKCFPNVECLTIRLVNIKAENASMSSMKDLVHLKTLNFSAAVSQPELYSLLAHLAKINKLEVLKLSIDEVIDDFEEGDEFDSRFDILKLLGGFSNLKTLNLRTPWQDTLRLINLVKQLTELRDLTLVVHTDGYYDDDDAVDVETLARGIIGSADKSQSGTLGFWKPVPSSWWNEFYHQHNEKLIIMNQNTIIGTILRMKKLQQTIENISVYLEENDYFRRGLFE